MENKAIMSRSDPDEQLLCEGKIMQRIVLVQIIAVLLVALISLVITSDMQFAIAVICGGGVSVVNTLLLTWRMRKSSAHIALDAHLQLRLMYFYAVERYLAVIVLLAICMLVFEFMPLALVAGFVMVQACFVAARLVLNRLQMK